MNEDPSVDIHVPNRVVANSAPPQPEKVAELTAWAIKSTIIDIDQARAVKPFTYPPLPEEFHSYVGRIALTWGQFDRLLTEMIVALMGHNKTVLKDEKWRFRFSFDQRCDLFQQEVIELFPNGHAASTYLTQIVDDGKALQLDRNLLVHGSINADARIHNNNGTTDFQIEHTLVALGFQKGAPIEKKFTLEDLKTIFYSLGHVAGRLNSFSPRQDNRPPTLPGASEAELKLVQDILRLHHPAYQTMRP